jgi:hypothetical protein
MFKKIAEQLEYLGAIVMVLILTAGALAFCQQWVDVNFHLPV